MLKDCEPALASAYLIGKAKYEAAHPGKELIVTCTSRSVEEQAELYTHGRTRPGEIVTWVDGTTQKSNHNYTPSRAIDFAVLIGGKVTWSAAEYDLVGPYMREAGLAWGGDWSPKKKDRPHVELPA